MAGEAQKSSELKDEEMGDSAEGSGRSNKGPIDAEMKDVEGGAGEEAGVASLRRDESQESGEAE